MNRELDVQIAQKLFGIPLVTDSMEIPCPYYSASSIHVCEILEELRKRGYSVDIHCNNVGLTQSHLFWVYLCEGDSRVPVSSGSSSTLPLALCKAAIKAVG